MTTEDSAAEKKRKRLEAWKRRRQQITPPLAPPAPPPPPPVKVSLSLNVSSKQPKHRKKKIVPLPPKPINPFGSIDADDEDDDSEDEGNKRGKLSLGLGFSLTDDLGGGDGEKRPSKRRKGRWDAGPGEQPKESEQNSREKAESSMELSTSVSDTLEKFMDKLQAGAMGSVATQVSEASGTELLSIDVGGSMMRVPKLKQSQPPPVSGGVITSEQLAKMSSTIGKSMVQNSEAFYTHSDWESDDQHGGASEVSYINE